MKYTVKIAIINATQLKDHCFFKVLTRLRVRTPYGDTSAVFSCGKVRGVDCIVLNRYTSPGKINLRADIWALKQQRCTHIILFDMELLDPFFDSYEHIISAKNDNVVLKPSISPDIRSMLLETSKAVKIDLIETGTGVATLGPLYYCKHRSWEDDLANRTLAPEAEYAYKNGMLYDSLVVVTEAEVWEYTGHFSINDFFLSQVKDVIIESVPKIAAKNWDAEIDELIARSQQRPQ